MSVLSSEPCTRLLRRLAHLQAAADALDVEGIHPLQQQLQSQRHSSGRPDQEAQQHDDEAMDEEAAVHALSQRLLSRPPPVPTLQCSHHTAGQAIVAIGAEADAGAQPLAVSAAAASAASLRLSESERAQAVRDYLIAHSLKDCSICVNAVTAEAEDESGSGCPPAEETLAERSSWYGQSHRWRLSEHVHGLYRLHVLDLELKPAAAIARHSRLDADIVRHYLQLTDAA